MTGEARSWLRARRLWLWAGTAVVLFAAALLGSRASARLLVMLLSFVVLAVLLEHPSLGALGLVPAALVAQAEFGTGTEVALNPVTLFLPFVCVVWFLDMARRRSVRLVASRTNLPLLLFLLGGLVSLLIGTVYWDPAVPRPDRFGLVQLAQWAIVAFSAAAFWLVGNLGRGESWLRYLSFSFLTIAGVLSCLLVLSRLPYLAALGTLLERWATYAVRRSPFWMLFAAVAGGQLLFNQRLVSRWRAACIVALVVTLIYAFYLERQTVSNWVGVGAVLGTLAWLRFPRLRLVAVMLVLVLALTGVLTSGVYDFAGGEDEWIESGGSRLALIRHVVLATMRNPVTGLGPAAYRRYALTMPLLYQGVYYYAPWVSSHNNWIDIFSHFGLLGLGLFCWFAVEVARLGLRLRRCFPDGFEAGYVNAMLAAWAGSLVLMLFADWILPFVYNLGFGGFQASVLVWLFLGGLVALEGMPSQGAPV